MFEMNKTPHYNFAHLALPVLALGNPRKFYKDLSRTTGANYLFSIWAGIEAQMRVKQPCLGLKLNTNSLSKNRELFLIKMPEPTYISEAVLVGIVFDMEKRLWGKKPVSAQYFTLEQGNSGEYYFCEWVGVFEQEHKNYGRLPKKDGNTFIQAIKHLLDNNSLTEIKTPVQSINDSSDLSSGESLDSLPDDVQDSLYDLSEYHIKHTSTDFKDWSKAMIDDAGNWVEPYLKEAYSGITGKIYFEPDSDFNALVMSVAAGLAKSMPTAQKELFSNWAGLPKDDWNEFHYEEFGLAFLHYLQSLNQRDKVSQSTLEEAARVFTNAALPPLKHPLTEEIIHMLDNLFDK